MRMIGKLKAWIWGHKLIAAAIAVLVVGWILHRLAGSGRGGHTTVAEAIAAGWTVYPAGITGWKEVGPDGTTEVWHMTGWTADPSATA
jgi:hypothetical protein